MELGDLNEVNIHRLSANQINEIIKKSFTDEEWAQTDPNRKISYRVLLTVYISDPEIAEKYTLREFLLRKEPEPEKKFPQISGSPKDYPKPERFDTNFWHTYTSCDLSSDESDVPCKPRKPTLEELWDASDAEHERERSERRTLEAMAKSKRDQGIKKKRERKVPPKKRGIKSKTPAKPTLKLPGKPRGRKPKTITEPNKTPTTRGKNAPVTRLQVSKPNAAETASVGERAESINVTYSDTAKGEKSHDVPHSAAQKTEIKSDALKSDPKTVTEKKSGLKRTKGQRVAERVEAKCAADKTAAKYAAEGVEVKKKHKTETEETGMVKEKPEANTVTEMEATTSAIVSMEANEVTDNSEGKDAPPAKRRRRPRRRFVPPPPPPCFYNKPPYKLKKNYIDLTKPRTPEPLYRSYYYDNRLFNPYEYGPSHTAPRFPPGVVDLTGQSTSSVLVNRRLESPQWNFPQSSSHIPRLPPPLAPLSYKLRPHIEISSDENSSSSDKSLRTKLEFSRVSTPPPIPYNLIQSRRYLEQITSAATTAVYCPSQEKQPENTETIIGPGFYVPRTLEKVSGQLETKFDMSMGRENRESPSSIGEIQDLSLPKPSTSAAFASTSKVIVTEQTPMSVPTVKISTTTPDTLTYVKSPQVPASHQPSTSSTFAVPRTHLSVAAATENSTQSITDKNKEEFKVLSHIPPTVRYAPVMTFEREKRIQPRRVINKKKFIVTTKRSEIPTFRPTNDYTSNEKENEGVILPTELVSGERQREITKTDRQVLGKRPAEMKLPETESSDTDASAEIKPSIKKTVIGKALPADKPQIKVPPHVKPCPTHCPALTIQTKPFLTTYIRGKVNTIAKQKSETTVTASSEGLLNLSKYQPAHAEALSTLTRPSVFGNIGYVPLPGTSEQKQLRTYPGPAKRGKRVPEVSLKQTAQAEVTTTKTPVTQVQAGKTRMSQIPSFQTLVGHFPVGEPSVMPAPLNLVTQKREKVDQMPLVQPQVYKRPATRLPIIHQPINLSMGDRPIRQHKQIFRSHPDLPSSSLEEDEMIKRQILLAPLLAQPINLKANRYAANDAPPNDNNLSEPKSTTISRISSSTINYNLQSQIETYPTKRDPVVSISSSSKTITTNQLQLTSSAKTKVVQTDVKSPLPIKTVDILTKSTDIKSDDTTLSQVNPLTAKSEYTSSSMSNKIPITRDMPIKTIPVKMLAAPEKIIQPEIIHTSTLSPASGMIFTTPSQIKTFPTKTLANDSTSTTQSQIKTIPAKTIQTIEIVHSSTQAQIKTTSARTVQATGTLSLTTQTQIKSVQTLGTPLPTAQPQIQPTTVKSAQTSVSRVPIKTILGNTVHISATLVPETQTQIKTLPYQAVQIPKTQVPVTQAQIEPIPAQTAQATAKSIPTLQLKEMQLQLIKQPDGEVKVIQGLSKPNEVPILTHLKKVAAPSTSTSHDRSVTKGPTGICDIDAGKKSGSPQSEGTTRRGGLAPAMATLIPVKKLIQTSKTATTTQGSLVQAKLPLTATKVAQVQTLLSKMQSICSQSQKLQQASTAEMVTTTEESSTLSSKNIGSQVQKESALAETRTVVGSIPGTPTLTISTSLKNIKILTPIRTSTEQFDVPTSLPDVRPSCSQSGKARISLVGPGIYQIVHSTPTSTSEPILYTSDEMLATEVVLSDVKTNIRRVIYKKVTVAPESPLPVRSTPTATSATATATTTSRATGEKTTEVEETPKLDEE